MSSLRIGQRLLIAFVAVIGLLCVVAAVSLSLFDGLAQVTRQIVEVQTRRANFAEQANQHAQRAAICLLKLLQTEERERRITLYGEMDAELAAADAAVDRIGATAQAPAEQARQQQLLAVRDNYDERFRETVELLELAGPQKARAHFDDRTQLALNALLQETSALAAAEQQRMRDDLDQLKRRESEATRIVIALAVTALLLGMALAWFMTRSIVVPVGEAVGVAATIAAGQLNQAVPQGGKDEVGTLLRALDSMRGSILVREEKILRLAYEDALTGLPNRTRFIETFAAQGGDRSAAVILLDINRFTLINHALGHAVGDQLLREVGQRISQLLGRCCQVARIWGNQFAFLLGDADRATASALVDSIHALFAEPLEVAGQRLDVGITLGIALFPDDGNDAATLLRRAEAAMRAAKRQRLGHAFSRGAELEPPSEQLSLLGRMRAALAREEFVVHYQPKLRLADNCICAAEALLRWQDPTRGLVPPGQFIPFAEQTGFIREITPWLIERVIGHAAAWQRAGLDIIPSVNLSTYDLLNADLLAHVDTLLVRHGLAPERLCLEITESALMEEPETALANLRAFAARGLKLSIDDYGSGQASLAYIQILPVNELKIDRAFVTDVASSRKNGAIVRSTVVLSHELDLTVVAEGAETQEELDWLRAAGCDMVQGYVVARPLPLDGFLDWVNTQPNPPRTGAAK